MSRVLKLLGRNVLPRVVKVPAVVVEVRAMGSRICSLSIPVGGVVGVDVTTPVVTSVRPMEGALVEARTHPQRLGGSEDGE